MFKTTLNILLFCAVCFSVPSAFAKKYSLVSSEETEFVGKDEKPLVDFNKTDKFVGILTRTSVKDSLETDIDVYEFPSTKKMDKTVCESLRDQVFGPAKEISLKVKSLELFSSPRAGEVCESSLTDEDPNGKIKERHFMAFKLGDKTYGLVFRFMKTPSKEQSEDARNFVKSLRAQK